MQRIAEQVCAEGDECHGEELGEPDANEDQQDEERAMHISSGARRDCDSRLPKQAEQTIRCLTFVAAKRRAQGKALIHEV